MGSRLPLNSIGRNKNKSVLPRIAIDIHSEFHKTQFEHYKSSNNIETKNLHQNSNKCKLLYKESPL